MKKLNSRGQIVVEYVLLLSVGIAIAVVLTKSVSSRDPDSPGFLISAWVKISEAIGADLPDVGPAGN
ncbi:MAG: hypothetical protein AB7O96_01380 [Pseudobdellovibrionaceae bacterium]